MPPANNLPKTVDEREERYPLELAVCHSCFLVQLCHVVDPAVLFMNYLYSSSSGLLGDHFDELAGHLAKMLPLDDGSVVVDIGSNDGLLLSRFKNLGICRIRGVEPASNLAATARGNGIPTTEAFFSTNVVDTLLSEDGNTDLVTATNVFAHVDDIKGLTSNVGRLLKPGGVFVIEVPYLPKMLENGTFDLVYHEHLSYFSVTPLVAFFRSMGMELFRVEHLSTHGGSIRVFVQGAEGIRRKDPSVETYLAEERGLRELQTFVDFGRRATDVVGSFARDIAQLKGKGCSIAGYAAPAKASTLLGHAQIDDRHFDYIVDDNPLKQGRFVPGTRIPIVSSSRLEEQPPDYLVILAWNLADAIIGKLGGLRERGVKFIVPFCQTQAVRR